MSSAPTQSGFPSTYHERERELSDVASDFNREASPLVGDSLMTRNSSSVRDSVASDYEVINPIGERIHVPRRFKPAAARERERSTWAGKYHRTAFIFIVKMKIIFSTKRMMGMLEL